MKYEWLDAYLLSMKGATKDYKEEWQWFRYQVGNKLFAAICKNGDGLEDILTIKLDPMDGDFLRKQYKEVKPGYYMNKVHWNSINLDGDLPDDLMKEIVEKSYHLVLGGLSKKLQKEIEEK